VAEPVLWSPCVSCVCVGVYVRLCPCKVIHKHVDGSRPNVVWTGKRWPSRSGKIWLLSRCQMWIHCRSCTFLSITRCGVLRWFLSIGVTVIGGFLAAASHTFVSRCAMQFNCFCLICYVLYLPHIKLGFKWLPVSCQNNKEIRVTLIWWYCFHKLWYTCYLTVSLLQRH